MNDEEVTIAEYSDRFPPAFIERVEQLLNETFSQLQLIEQFWSLLASAYQLGQNNVLWPDDDDDDWFWDEDL